MNGLRRQLERAMQAALDDAGHTLSPATVALLAKAAAERVVWPLTSRLTTERDQARADLAAKRGDDTIPAEIAEQIAAITAAVNEDDQR